MYGGLVLATRIPVIFWLKHSIIMVSSLIVMVSCGGFEASQHPDDSFRFGEGIGNAHAFGQYYGNQTVDPRFRRAQVTTQSSPLALKTTPRRDGAAPSTGPTSLARGSEVDVYWPLDVENNHIKLHVEGRALWATYRSSGGQEYVTLLEDIYVPQTSVPSSGSFSLNTAPSFGPQMAGGATAPILGGSNNSDGFMPEDLNQISLTAAQLRSARTAISNVALTPSSVSACTFNPIVGNNAGSNNCYREIIVSSAFRDFVSRHGHQCAVEAAQSAFGFRPSRVLFHSSGAGQVRPNRTVSGSGTLSTHATGQAFDLFAISVFNSSTSRKVPMHRDHVDGSSSTERQNHEFYWSFTRCWRARVQTQAPCACSGSRTGALTYSDNSAHYNHLHMSMPMCNRERYNVSCI